MKMPLRCESGREFQWSSQEGEVQRFKIFIFVFVFLLMFFLFLRVRFVEMKCRLTPCQHARLAKIQQLALVCLNYIVSLNNRLINPCTVWFHSIHVPSWERSHIPSQGIDMWSFRVYGLLVCFLCCVLCFPFFVVSIWFSIWDDRMCFFLEGINAQCHTGETVLMLALKDGQVWMADGPQKSQVLEGPRLRNVWGCQW